MQSRTHPGGTQEATASVAPERYLDFIGPDDVERLKRLAAPLEGRGWAHVDAALPGDGAVEYLLGVLPLARGLGIDATRHCLETGPEFRAVARKIRNLFVGRGEDLSLAEFAEAYLGAVHGHGLKKFVSSDLIVLHGPEPLALAMSGGLYGNVLWRCHLDISIPDPAIWRLMLPYINHCAGAVLESPEFAGPGLQIPLYHIAPGIDPLCGRNRPRTQAEAQAALEPLFTVRGIDPERPILACLDPENPAAALDAFALLRESKPDPAPQLVFLARAGQIEAETAPDGLRSMAGDSRDVHLLVDDDEEGGMAGALLRLARALVLSVRGGSSVRFAAEALWQGTPVIGMDRRGLRALVRDGETGFLLPPDDAAVLAGAMGRLLSDDAARDAMGQAGRALVGERFLLPDLLGKELELLRYYSRVDRRAPDFRLSELTYSEVLGAMRPRPPFFPED